MKSIGSGLIIMTILSIMGIAAVICYLNYRRSGVHAEAEGHAIGSTRGILVHALDGIENWSIEEPAEFRAARLDGKTIFGGELFGIMKSGGRRDSISEFLHDGSDMTDVWNHPLLCHFESRTDKWDVAIWSSGPNGVDESCKGDDIVAHRSIRLSPKQ